MKQTFSSFVGILGLVAVAPFAFGSLRADTVTPTSTEGLRYDLYENVSGTAVSNLAITPGFPDKATVGNQLWTKGFLRTPRTTPELNGKVNLGERMSGYLIAPATGNYVFWVGGQDSTALFLSPDTDPAKKVKIAWTNAANASDAATGLPVWLSCGTPTGKSAANAFTFNGGAPGTIKLEAGKIYYIELLHKAGPNGAGSQAVGWTLPGDTVQAAAPTEVIPSKFLSPNLVAVPNLNLTNEQLASRFLNQATCGATPEDIASLAAALATNPRGAYADWLKDQFAREPSDDDLSLNIFRTYFPPNYPVYGYRQHTHDAAAVRASLMISDNKNELRRKVSYVLSEIFVVSDEDAGLVGAPEGMCDWYDLLFKNAFSDFTNLLTEVTYSPVMSHYLSSAGNAKAGFFNKGSRPDENYAREIMQLFTIGLYDLNRDGSYVTDNHGKPIASYNQNTITEMARVFTGLKYPTGMGEGRAKGKDFRQWVAKKGSVRFGRDEIDERKHDTDEKTVFMTKIPAGQDTAKDIADALNILVNHPNTAPFFAKAMIQHMVTSNPSPAYVKHVADAFVNNHGDLKAVITAVLLDPEARNPSCALDDQYGKLREPWMRVTQLTRSFKAIPKEQQPYYNVYKANMLSKLGEYPFAAPSVFNFFLPSYQSPGVVTRRNLGATDAETLVVAPEFQIMNSNTSLLTPNYIMDLVYNDGYGREENKPDKMTKHGLQGNKRGLPQLDLSPQLKLAANAKDLIDNVDTLLTSGMMSQHTREIISTAVNAVDPADEDSMLQRTQMAIYLTMMSPDYAIQK